MSSSLTVGTVVLIVGIATVTGGVAIYTGAMDDVFSDDNEITADSGESGDSTSSTPGVTETDDSDSESSENNSTPNINETELIESHVEILTENSATIDITTNDEDKTFKSESSSTYLTKHDNSGTEKYSTDEYTLVNENGDYYGEHEIIEDEEFIKEDEFTSFLRFLAVDSYEETSDGDLKLSLTGEDEHLMTIPEDFGFYDIETITVDLVITSDGLIKESNYEMYGEVYQDNDETKTKTGEYRVSDVDETTFTQPEWVSEAESTIAIIDGVYDAYSGWMLIQHEYLNTVPAGTEIIITDATGEETYTVETPSDMESGGGMGLSLLEDDTWDIAVDEMPEEGVASDMFEYTIRAEHPNGQEYFNKSFSD